MNIHYISFIDDEIKKNNPYLSTSGGLKKNLLNNSYWYNFIQLAKWCVNGNIKDMNYEEIGELIKFFV